MTLERKVSSALAKLRKVLDNEKAQPVIAAEQPHTYDDKFALAESLTGLLVASSLATLGGLGADRAALRALAATGKAVTLRVTSTETCRFLRKAEREVPSTTKVETSSSLFGKSETRVVSTVTEYFWSLGLSYKIVLFAGPSANGADAKLVAGREAACEVLTRSEKPPIAERHEKPPVDCDVTWLLSHLRADGNLSVRVDRDSAKCITPRRNPTVDDALSFVNEFRSSMEAIKGLFKAAQKLEGLGKPTGDEP